MLVRYPRTEVSGVSQEHFPTYKIIPAMLSERLQRAKSMRNIIAHEYGTIDDELVFIAITEELIDDVEQFTECIGRIK